MLTTAMTATLIQRLRSGEAATVLARKYRRRKSELYRLAHDNGIRLRRGVKRLDPRAYAVSFDKRHGPGKAGHLLRRATEVQLKAVGHKFGRKTKEWARQTYYRLGGQRKNLAAVRRPQKFFILWRPDVTLEKILRLAKYCRSKESIAFTLNCSTATVNSRLKGLPLHLPNKYRPPRKRPDVTISAVRREARRRSSVLAMGKALNTSHITILHRAGEGDIILPNGRVGPKPKTLRTLEHVARYRNSGLSFPEIAKITGRNTDTLKSIVHRHHSLYRKFIKFITQKLKSKAA